MRSLITLSTVLTKYILQTKVITLNNKTTISLSLGKKIKIFQLPFIKQIEKQFEYKIKFLPDTVGHLSWADCGRQKDQPCGLYETATTLPRTFSRVLGLLG